MKNAYYEMTVPLLVKNLSNLDGLLTIAEAFRNEKGMEEDAILGARLAPDMFPFIMQIRIATDNAKGLASRLAGVDIPVMEDAEVTFAELHERIAKTIAYLHTLTPEQFEGAEDRHITLKYFPGMHFTGHNYLREYALPNFFFHVTTAYDILRSIGVVIGKENFLGHLSLEQGE